MTAARTAGGEILGYLNITPQQGQETLANWASFRPAHNQEEGDSNLMALASATGFQFQGARARASRTAMRPSPSTGTSKLPASCGAGGGTT